MGEKNNGNKREEEGRERSKKEVNGGGKQMEEVKTKNSSACTPHWQHK